MKTELKEIMHEEILCKENSIVFTIH